MSAGSSPFIPDDRLSGIREAAGVSEECMNRVYEMLRQLPIAMLKEMWLNADPWEPRGLLIRHQLNVTIERKLSGQW